MMLRKLGSYVVVSSVLAVVGCSSSQDGLLRSGEKGGDTPTAAAEENEARAPAAPGGQNTGPRGIIGGTPDTADAAVVAVVAYKDGGKTYSQCTGEVIAPDVVLTASHCVDPRALGFVPEGVQIMTSQDIAKATQADIITARSAVPHPKYDPATGANDIAIVLLQKKTSVSPLPYSRVPLEGNDGKQARIIGYGTTKDGDSSTAGKKNQATVKLSQINAHDFVAATLPATQCHGDSGGPTLLSVNGKETIIGIGWITVRNDGLCSEGVRDTRVDKFLDFIDPFVAASTGGKPGTPGTPGTPGAPGTPGTNGNDVCCYNGQFYDCPSSAACLGGFDIDACLNACTTPACDIACAQKLSGVRPTNQCTRAPAKDIKCHGG